LSASARARTISPWAAFQAARLKSVGIFSKPLKWARNQADHSHCLSAASRPVIQVTQM